MLVSVQWPVSGPLVVPAKLVEVAKPYRLPIWPRGTIPAGIPSPIRKPASHRMVPCGAVAVSSFWACRFIRGGALCVEFRLAIALIAADRKRFTVRTERPGETLQRYSSSSAPPDATAVCTDISVRSSGLRLNFKFRQRRSQSRPAPMRTSGNARRKLLTRLRLGAFPPELWSGDVEVAEAFNRRRCPVQ